MGKFHISNTKLGSVKLWNASEPSQHSQDFTGPFPQPRAPCLGLSASASARLGFSSPQPQVFSSPATGLDGPGPQKGPCHGPALGCPHPQQGAWAAQVPPGCPGWGNETLSWQPRGAPAAPSPDKTCDSEKLRQRTQQQTEIGKAKSKTMHFISHILTSSSILN